MNDRPRGPRAIARAAIEEAQTAALLEPSAVSRRANSPMVDRGRDRGCLGAL